MSQPLSCARPATDLPSSPPDDGLLARLHAGEESAFADLVRRHGASLLATARRLLANPEDAADAVQETFLSAVRALPGFRGSAALSTWLHRIAINHALMKRRKQRRLREAVVEDLLPRFTQEGHHAAAPGGYAECPSRQMERAELRERVRDGIARLPDSYRNALILRDIQEMALGEVAARLNVSVNAAKIRVHRGRQALRQLLVEAEVASA